MQEANNNGGDYSSSFVHKSPQKFIKPLTLTSNQLNQFSTSQQSQSTFERRKSQVSSKNNPIGSHNTTTTITRPTGASSHVNESVIILNGSDQKNFRQIGNQSFQQQHYLQFVPPGQPNSNNVYFTPNQINKNKAEKFTSEAKALQLSENPLAYHETVKLPVIKAKLKYKKQKRKKIAKSPSSKDAKNLNSNYSKQQNMANYDFEEKQNSRIAKLLNLGENFNERDLQNSLLNYNSDENTQTQPSTKNRQSYPAKPQYYSSKGVTSNIYQVDERDQYIQSLQDQTVKLPIIAPDTQLQKHLNNYSEKNIIENQDLQNLSKLRSNSSMNHHARNDYFSSLKRPSNNLVISTPGQSNAKTTNRTLNQDTILNTSQRNITSTQDKLNENIDALAQITLDSRKLNLSGKQKNAYQIYQQNLLQTAQNVLDQSQPFVPSNHRIVTALPAYQLSYGNNSFQTSAQIYNQKAPNYMRPTQKFMNHIKEVSSGKSSQRNLHSSQKHQSLPVNNIDSKYQMQQQVYRYPFHSQLDQNVPQRFYQDNSYFQEQNSNTPIQNQLMNYQRPISQFNVEDSTFISQNQNYNQHRHLSSQNVVNYQTNPEIYQHIKAQSSLNINQKSQNQLHGGQNKRQASLVETEQMRIEREQKIKEQNERIQSIVQKLTSPRKKNKFCPCCAHKYEHSSSHSPYRENGSIERNKNQNQESKESLTNSKGNIKHYQSRNQVQDHNQSENNIIERKRYAYSVNSTAGGFPFLKKGQNKLAHRRIPEGVHLNQYPLDMSDTQSNYSQLHPKFKGLKNSNQGQWKYIGNKSYLVPQPNPDCKNCGNRKHQNLGKVGISNNSFKDSLMQSPRFANAQRISPEVEERLLGRGNTCKKICSTLHNEINTPMQKKQSTLESIIKPRPVSAEKILTHDISLSPIQFSIRDEDNQVSAGVFSPKVEKNEFEQQTGNHLLDNYKWKEGKSIQIETEQEEKKDPIVEILQDPIVIPIVQTPPVIEKKKQKQNINYDWAQSEIFKYVQDLHNYEAQISKQNQNQHNQDKKDSGLLKSDLQDQSKEKLQQQASRNQQKQLSKQQQESIDKIQNSSNPSIVVQDTNQKQQPDIQIDDYTDVLNNEDKRKFQTLNQSQEKLDADVNLLQTLQENQKSSKLLYPSRSFAQNQNQNDDCHNSQSNLQSDFQTDAYRTPFILERIDLMSKETDRQSQMTAQKQVEHNILDNEEKVRRFGGKNINLMNIQNYKQLEASQQKRSIKDGDQNFKATENGQIHIDNQNPNQSNPYQNIRQTPSQTILQNLNESKQVTINPNEPFTLDYNSEIQNQNQQDFEIQQQEILQAPEDDFNPNKFLIYTEIEATYKASLLKKKARTYNTPETLREFHQIAKKTIEVLTWNMIQADISLEKIFEFYEEVTRENVIKLLLRCRLLYQARVDIKKILLLIIKKEEMYEDIKQIMSLGGQNLNRLNQNQLAQLFSDGLRTIQRLLSSINNFRHEHKIFKGQFIFKGQDYQETLVQERNLIQDYIWNHGNGSGSLQETINEYQSGNFQHTQNQRYADFDNDDCGNNKQNQHLDTKIGIQSNKIENSTKDVKSNSFTKHHALEQIKQGQDLDNLIEKNQTNQILIEQPKVKAQKNLEHKPNLQIQVDSSQDYQDN